MRGPARRLVLPGGHAPHVEHEDAVVAAIAAFVADLR
jgi:pimeloyl-ACP methyl ester carboxylesterase